MVYADANIALELLLDRRKQTTAVARLLGHLEQPSISTLTAHIVWYFARKDGVSDSTTAEHIAAYDILSLLPEDYTWAIANEHGKDFEDALQVAVALRNKCEQFVTLDNRLIKRYDHLPLGFINPIEA